MWYTVNKETGDKIDSFMTLENAVSAIRMYYADDKLDGSYTEDFYDVYNDTYDLYAHGDWRHVYELAILCADHCTKEEAQKHYQNGVTIYADTPFGFSEFVESSFDDGTPECYKEIRESWESLSSVTFENNSYKIDYVL